MEANHLGQVEEVQDMYDNKLNIQEAEYLNLEQEKLEMQKSYQDKIQTLISQNKQKIEDLLGSFNTDLKKVQNEYEECKRTSQANEDQKEGELDSIDIHHEDEMDDIDQVHEEKVVDLET